MPSGHDARIGRVYALRLARLVWCAGPCGRFGVLVYWCGLRTHPFPDAFDEANNSDNDKRGRYFFSIKMRYQVRSDGMVYRP